VLKFERSAIQDRLFGSEISKKSNKTSLTAFSFHFSFFVDLDK